jgi:hypothetical protein
MPDRPSHLTGRADGAEVVFVTVQQGDRASNRGWRPAKLTKITPSAQLVSWIENFTFGEIHPGGAVPAGEMTAPAQRTPAAKFPYWETDSRRPAGFSTARRAPEGASSRLN